MMGKNRDAEGIHRFARVDGDMVSLEPKTWLWMLDQSSRDLGLDVDCKTVRAPLGVRPGTTVLRRHPWNATRVDMFEAIPKGAELGFRVAIMAEAGAPSPNQLQDMLEYIGDYIGMSQWGSKPPFGYGRFKVLYVKELRHGAERSGTNPVEGRGSGDNEQLQGAGG